jgi:hypothetical protein
MAALVWNSLDTTLYGMGGDGVDGVSLAEDKE